MDTIDRRKASRIKIVEIKPEYPVMLIFNEKVIPGKLLDLSEGGANVKINDQVKDKITQNDIGKTVVFRCKSIIPPTNIEKNSRIIRFNESDGNILIAVSFYV